LLVAHLFTQAVASTETLSAGDALIRLTARECLLAPLKPVDSAGDLEQLQDGGQRIQAVAIDGRYHRERTKAGRGSVDYNEAMLRTYRTGKDLPFPNDNRLGRDASN
jgi:hypothetical protein